VTTWFTREQLVHQVVTLAAQGVSRRGISRALSVSRNTVKSILLSHDQQRARPHSALPDKSERAPRSSKLDPFKPRVAELLDKYPDVTVQRVFELLRDDGFDGCYSTVKNHVRLARPAPKPTPSLETPDYGPGKMAESDWSPYELRFTDGTQQKVQLFGYTLPFSTRKFYQGYLSYDTHALMTGHVEAFEHFEGLAACCKYDGQKAVVLRWEGRQPIYNPRFLAFAAHYEFRPRAIRGNPNARPNVERSFWTFEKSFLPAREFRDLSDFNYQLRQWLATVVDQRTRHGQTPLQRFVEEKPHLVPLPAHPYDTARVVYRVCGIDGYVEWQGNRYAVPYDHVTDLLPVRVTQHELFIYAADLQCIARHELAPRGQGLKLDPLGFHKATRRPAIDLDQLRLAFQRMGERSSEFFRLLSSGPPRQWAHAARRILLLRQRYATDDIDQALSHAARFGAFSFEAIERIVEARHRPRTLDEYVAEQTARRLEAELGTKPTEPRDLSEYDRLPVHCGRDVSSALSAPNQENDPWPHAANPKSNESPLTTADEGTRPAPQTPISPDSSRTSSSSDSDT
jgi:transposase